MNKVVHFEIPYENKERAMEFYRSVFEWDMQDMPEMDYTIARTTEVDENFMIKEPGAINGGMYERGGDAAQGPVLVIDVPSVDAHIEKVRAAGGEVVVEKRVVGDMGYYAQVRDTEGNIVGIWETIKQ